MRNKVRLSNSVSGVTDANGNLSLIFNGPKPNQVWTMTRFSIQIPETKKIPSFRVYKGIETPTNFLTSSATGQNDTDELPETTMHPGEFLTCVWTGADANVRATFFAEGVNDYGVPQY